ncbi:MAG: aldehyde dehydrogenase family protein [Parvularculaceae bacterium]
MTKALETYMEDLAATARAAARAMASASTEKKNTALKNAAALIRSRANSILSVNAEELEFAKAKGVADAFLDRMALNPERVESIAVALEDIAALPDPVGKSIAKWSRPNGLEIERVRTPIGVVAIIYESRPNVTADAAAIAVKAGNAVILRGGSECIKTSKTLFDCLAEGLRRRACPPALRSLSRRLTAQCGRRAPLRSWRAHRSRHSRGGKSLVARAQAEARALSLDGNCHGPMWIAR